MSHPVPASAPDNECEGKKDGNSWNRMLGTDHSEAVSYMSTTKERMEDIMSYVDDIHDDPVTDTLELCFAETKRAVAMQAGLEAFDAIDVDHDGTLTATEVNDFFTDNPAVLEKITSVKAEQFSTDWARMLQLLDVNNDQSVSRDEFLAFFAENGLGTEHAAVLFDEIDESQDGTLSLHELKRRLQTDTALKATLSGVRMRRLHQEWDAFFAALRDGTSGAVDRTQFASLWCASGLGLNVASAAPATRAASPSPSPPPAAASSQQGSPPALYSRPMTPLTPASGSHGSAVLAPRPPSSCRPSSARPYSSHMSQYLTRDEVWLERPCVKGRVNYGELLNGQTSALSDRESSIGEYKVMLKKVEEYQQAAVRVLEAHYCALGENSKWRHAQAAALKNTHPFARLLPPIPVGGKSPLSATASQAVAVQ